MKEVVLLTILGIFPLMTAGSLYAQNENGHLRPEDFKGAVRVACVGDSITYGSEVENRETNSYPAVLGRLLGPKFETKNFGVDGATLLKKGDHPYWKEPVFKAVDDYQPNAIVIKLGTNDSKRQNWKYRKEFEPDLHALIAHFQALGSKPRIWLCFPAPVMESRWGVNKEVVRDEIMPKIKKVAAEKGLPTIDVYFALKEKPDFFSDKIHPNAAGARVIARTVYAALTGKEPSQ